MRKATKKAAAKPAARRGRPPLDPTGTLTRRYMVRLPDHLGDWLEAQPGGAALAARHAIAQAMIRSTSPV